MGSGNAAGPCQVVVGRLGRWSADERHRAASAVPIGVMWIIACALIGSVVVLKLGLRGAMDI